MFCDVCHLEITSQLIFGHCFETPFMTKAAMLFPSYIWSDDIISDIITKISMKFGETSLKFWYYFQCQFNIKPIQTSSSLGLIHLLVCPLVYGTCSFLACLNNVHVELLYYRRRPQMLKFFVKVFKTSLFPNPTTDLVHIWYDDTYWSKILCSTISTPLGISRSRSQT